jgi:hypothetical protein
VGDRELAEDLGGGAWPGMGVVAEGASAPGAAGLGGAHRAECAPGERQSHFRMCGAGDPGARRLGSPARLGLARLGRGRLGG